MRERVLQFISAAAGIAYLVTAHWQPFPGSAGVKGLAVGSLAVLAFGDRRRDARLLALALAFSTAGDVLLDLSPSLFAAGLAAFLLTHITYIALFARNRTANWRFHPATAILAIYSFSLSLWIVPAAGALAIPVIFYICALTAMAAMAFLARFRSPWVAIGAVLFVISDSLLAIHRFR